MSIIEKLIKDLGEDVKFWNHYANCPDCYIDDEGFPRKCVLTNEVVHGPRRPPSEFERRVTEAYAPLVLQVLREQARFNAIQERETETLSLGERTEDSETVVIEIRRDRNQKET